MFGKILFINLPLNVREIEKFVFLYVSKNQWVGNRMVLVEKNVEKNVEKKCEKGVTFLLKKELI